MNINFGFEYSPYGVISFDENDQPRPFPGSFYEGQKHCMFSDETSYVLAPHVCSEPGYRNYSYIELFNSSGDERLKFVTLTSQIDRYINEHFNSGPYKNECQLITPKEASAIKGMIEILNSQTVAFKSKYEARQQFEKNISHAKSTISAYIAKRDAYEQIRSGGAAEKSLGELKENSRISDENFEKMNLFSRQTLSIHQFLKHHDNDTSEKGVLLGLNHQEITQSVASIIDFEDYGETYERYYGNIIENENFMDDLTQEGKPILFLIPNEIFTHERKGATARELEWLLDHPEKMKNVTFVFGAYDCIPDTEPPYDDCGSYISSYEENMARRIFKQIMRDTAKPPKKLKDYELMQKHLQLSTTLEQLATQKFDDSMENKENLKPLSSLSINAKIHAYDCELD
jgi:hypothetical protein